MNKKTLAQIFIAIGLFVFLGGIGLGAGIGSTDPENTLAIWLSVGLVIPVGLIIMAISGIAYKVLE